MAMERLDFLPASRVKELLQPKKLIDVIEDALILFSKREGVQQPVRSTVSVQQHHGFFGVMPAYVEAAGCMGAKLVGFYADNAAKGLDSHHAIIALFEPTTGSPMVMMDGEVITTLRTAAASAVAVKHLSNTSAKILCILGSGVQARSHARMLVLAREFQEIRVWGRSEDNLKKCVDDITVIVGSSIRVTACLVLSEAVCGADVVVTVTLATEPVLLGKWVKAGALICSVGACRPNWREIDDDVMHNAWVVVDTREGAMKESGDILLSKADIYAELGEIAANTKKLPAFSQEKKFIVFKSLGMAIEDVISAKLVYDLSKQ